MNHFAQIKRKRFAKHVTFFELLMELLQVTHLAAPSYTLSLDQKKKKVAQHEREHGRCFQALL
jgi:hypothetical protein